MLLQILTGWVHRIGQMLTPPDARKQRKVTGKMNLRVAATCPQGAGVDDGHWFQTPCWGQPGATYRSSLWKVAATCPQGAGVDDGHWFKPRAGDSPGPPTEAASGRW